MEVPFYLRGGEFGGVITMSTLIFDSKKASTDVLRTISNCRNRVKNADQQIF
jgi:hypothetical protein